MNLQEEIARKQELRRRKQILLREAAQLVLVDIGPRTSLLISLNNGTSLFQGIPVIRGNLIARGGWPVIANALEDSGKPIDLPDELKDI